MIMVTTGITPGLLWLTILLPLFPLFIILFRRTWNNRVPACLLAISLLSCIHHLVLAAQPFSAHDAAFINALFDQGEWILMFYTLKLLTPQKWLRDVMSFFLVSFSSIVITIYVLAGVVIYALPIALLQNGILPLVALVVLIQLVRDRQIIIFKTAEFWIAGSALVYYGMLFFLEMITGNESHLSKSPPYEKLVVLAAVSSMRFILFAIAALMK